MAPVLKTGGRKSRGFESHSLLQYGWYSSMAEHRIVALVM